MLLKMKIKWISLEFNYHGDGVISVHQHLELLLPLYKVVISMAQHQPQELSNLKNLISAHSLPEPLNYYQLKLLLIAQKQPYIYIKIITTLLHSLMFQPLLEIVDNMDKLVLQLVNILQVLWLQLMLNLSLLIMLYLQINSVSELLLKLISFLNQSLYHKVLMVEKFVSKLLKVISLPQCQLEQKEKISNYYQKLLKLCKEKIKHVLYLVLLIILKTLHIQLDLRKQKMVLLFTQPFQNLWLKLQKMSNQSQFHQLLIVLKMHHLILLLLE